MIISNFVFDYNEYFIRMSTLLLYYNAHEKIFLKLTELHVCL